MEQGGSGEHGWSGGPLGGRADASHGVACVSNAAWAAAPDQQQRQRQQGLWRAWPGVAAAGAQAGVRAAHLEPVDGVPPPLLHNQLMAANLHHRIRLRRAAVAGLRLAGCRGRLGGCGSGRGRGCKAGGGRRASAARPGPSAQRRGGAMWRARRPLGAWRAPQAQAWWGWRASPTCMVATHCARTHLLLLLA